MVKYLQDRNPPISHLGEYYVCVDSDCDGDPPGIKGQPQGAKEEREIQARAVFVMGSFSTYVHFRCYRLDKSNEFPGWKSLLFYCYTGIITFAPLSSQGIEYRLDYIHQNTTVGAPPPRLPKSTYVLAGSVRLQRLGISRHVTDTIE